MVSRPSPMVTVPSVEEPGAARGTDNNDVLAEPAPEVLIARI